MVDRDEKIRVRAYEIWECQGRTGDPLGHWREAEREIRAEAEPTEGTEDRSDATVEAAAPVETVGALEATSHETTKGKRSRRPS
jgi:hypothetical protein